MQTQREFQNEQRQMDWYCNNPKDRIIIRRREIQYLAGGGLGGGRAVKREGAIHEFKPQQAKNLRRYIDNYYTDFEGMVTLTYGEDWPRDGRVVKAHLAAFFESIRRSKWFEKNSLVWWLEFQQRGAPHIHMVVTEWISKAKVSEWWSRVSGAPQKTSTRVEALLCGDRVGAYAAKYAAKQEQKQVPEGYTNVGRFWGRRGWKPESGAVPKIMAAATSLQNRSHVRAVVHSFLSSKAAGKGYVSLPHKNLLNSRAYEHEGGWSIYGDSREIAEIWRYLRDVGTYADQTELSYEDIPLQMLGESIAMLNMLGSQMHK